MAQYHKIPRRYFGVRVPAIAELARQYWKQQKGDGLLECCRELWRSDIHEARILTGKLLSVRKLLHLYGSRMKPFARREASKYLASH